MVMKKLDKGSLNQLENSMNQHISSNDKIYLFMDEYGRCGQAFTGNETHIMVQKAITTSDGRIELKKDEIEIPKGMKCEYKKVPILTMWNKNGSSSTTQIMAIGRYTKMRSIFQETGRCDRG